MKELMNNIKNFISSLKSKECDFNASSAYSMGCYGEVMSDEDLLNKFYKRVDEEIKNRSISGVFSVIIDLDDNMFYHSEELLKHYSDLGFYSKVLNKDLDKNIIGNYLFINWRKEKLS